MASSATAAVYREVCDPNTGTTFFLDIATGQFQWDRPIDGIVQMKNPDGADDEWWELHDEARNLPYYYNTGTSQTEWKRPTNGVIIPLRALQTSAVGQQMSSAVKRMSTMSASIMYYSDDNDSDTQSTNTAGGTPQSPRLNTPAQSPPLQPPQAPLQAPFNNNSNFTRQGSSNNRKYEQLGMVSGGSSSVAAAVVRASETGTVREMTYRGPEPGIGRERMGSSPPAVAAINLSRDSSYENRTSPTSPMSPGSTRANRIPKRPQEQVYNPNLASLPKVKPEVTELAAQDLSSLVSKFNIDAFAKEHFVEQRRGIIFRTAIPLEEVLKFQREPLRTPLMDLPKNFHRDALKGFRLVQKVMSDTSAGPPYIGSVREVQSILHLGITFGALRDEIYVQICKQVRGNSSAESTFRGWLLLCVIAIMFPPSKEFEEYMKTFTLEHYNGVPDNSWGGVVQPTWSKDKNSREQEAIGVLAKFCNKKLNRTCRTGARGKVPQIQEIERSQEAPFRASLFGETLEDIMIVQARENAKDSAGRKLALPRILLFLTDSILSLDGCNTEGIFRVPGDIDLVNDLRITLERGKYDLKDITDPHVPSSLLKLWLRELAEPLIPATLYDDCIEIGREAMAMDSEENVGDLAYELLAELPDINHRVALYMIKFLKVVAEKKNLSKTRMTHANIALVFAPNFLRCPSDNPMIIFENTKYEQSFIRVLLTNEPSP
ncbi:hypothetical protein BJ741DRAFT_587538 [Chytriomyces cf. hyalinus JEL632]|nr:hypothetical protein BJ741DRAFT_587538 [Chytriomyces cf. hyalinus JEL632]